MNCEHDNRKKIYTIGSQYLLVLCLLPSRYISPHDSALTSNPPAAVALAPALPRSPVSHDKTHSCTWRWNPCYWCCCRFPTLAGRWPGSGLEYLKNHPGSGELRWGWVAATCLGVEAEEIKREQKQFQFKYFFTTLKLISSNSHFIMGSLTFYISFILKNHKYYFITCLSHKSKGRYKAC